MAQLYLPDEDSELVTANRKPVRNFWMFWKMLAQAVPSGGAAPSNAEYIVGSADATLTAERVVTNTASITWDLTTPGQAKANAVNTGDVTGPSSSVDGEGVLFNGTTGKVIKRATGTGIVTRTSGVDAVGTLSGDVTTTGASLATTIAANAVTDAKFRQSVATSVVGRSANSTGNVADIQATVDNQVFVRRSSALVALAEQSIGYWSPLTNGDPVTPEIMWDSFGDTISYWTAA